MKQLIFQGYSDDTFACAGKDIDVDYDTCASGRPVWMRVQSGDDALLVCGQYASGPCAGWLIGIAPADWPKGEERHIPRWGMTFDRSDRPYSPHLIIVVPDDVVVTIVDDDGERKPLTQAERDTQLADLRKQIQEKERRLNNARSRIKELLRSMDQT